MKKISAIIVYNDQEKMSEAEGYLQKQELKTEIIALDNRTGKFASAAKALNYGAEMAQGEVLIFMHQDMLLTDRESTKKYYDYLIKHKDQIAGVAGVYKSDRTVHSDICRYKNKIKNLNPTNNIISTVYSLDECMFAMHRALWLKYKFDEITCDNWHMYAIDICYQNLLAKGENVLLPLEVWHKASPVTLKAMGAYSTTLKKFVKKYHGKIDNVYAPCSILKCNLLGFYFWKLKRFYVSLKKAWGCIVY